MSRRRFKKSGISDGLESGGQKKAFPHAERPTLTLSHPGATLASDFKISWKSSRATPGQKNFQVYFRPRTSLPGFLLSIGCFRSITPSIEDESPRQTPTIYTPGPNR